MATTRNGWTALAAACCVALAGCGADADDDAADGDAATRADGREAVDEVQEADGEDAVVVGMADYGYVDLPERVPAGTTFTVENRSETELHEFVAIRLRDDEGRSAEELVQLPPDQLAALLAEVRTVLLQPPGAPDVIPAVGDGTLAEAGRYLVVCAIPTGADPQEYLEAAAASEDGPPQVEGGPPHLVQGMWGELVVEG